MSAMHVYALGAMKSETTMAADRIRRLVEIINKNPRVASAMLLEVADQLDGAEQRALRIGAELNAKYSGEAA